MPDTPQGDTPDSARDKLVAAVLALLPEQPADALSVRDIAAQAGVNHGLVHRHFGSKEALLREAIARVSGQVHGESRGDQPSTWAWRLVRDRPQLVRILARVCLDGPKDLLPLAVPPPERLEEYVAPIRRTLAHAGLGHLDPYLVNAFTCSALLGFVVFRPLLEAGWKLPEDADAQLDQLLPLLDGFLKALDE